jgi:hypothetical protein
MSLLTTLKQNMQVETHTVFFVPYRVKNDSSEWLC